MYKCFINIPAYKAKIPYVCVGLKAFLIFSYCNRELWFAHMHIHTYSFWCENARRAYAAASRWYLFVCFVLLADTFFLFDFVLLSC